jgi:ferredoxin
MRVWIDQDLCTGDGLCTDHCPEVFVLLEDGISYVRDAAGVAPGPGGRASMVDVPIRHDDEVIAAAVDCPGECIFLETDDDVGPVHDHAVDDDDIEPADVVETAPTTASRTW